MRDLVFFIAIVFFLPLAITNAFIGFLLLMSGCRDRQDGVHTEYTDLQKEKLTIMHVDAESPGFRKFIENAEKELNLEI